jgi:membrane protease YdiL (CAAX protease family)
VTPEGGAWNIEPGTSQDMKTCSYCGKEYPDSELTCLIDGQPLIGEEIPAPYADGNQPEATIAIPVVVKSMSERRLLIIEVVLVCVLAFGGSILSSFARLFGGNFGGSNKGILYWTNGALHEGGLLALVWYLLLRRSRSWVDLGLVWAKSDAGWAVLLALGGSFAYSTVHYAIHLSGLFKSTSVNTTDQVGRILFSGGISAMTILFQFVNPFFEELIVRAYLMTQVRLLTNSAGKAILLSTILQTSYHFYQGVPQALSHSATFLLFSLYYAKTNRITPIILAHLFFDLSGTLSYAMRHG